MGCMQQRAQGTPAFFAGGANPGYMSSSQLQTLIESQCEESNNTVIIDVRDALVDYDGGHIEGHINISDNDFHQQISEIVSKYHDKRIIFYDMYGSEIGRAIACCRDYAICKKEIISHYSRKTQSSYYYIQGGDENEAKGVPRRVEIECNKRIISDLSKQRILVLQGGVFELVNSSFSNMVQNFDQSKWEQLELMKEKMWYHKNEYFSKDKFAELKEPMKSLKFARRSSKEDVFLREIENDLI